MTEQLSLFDDERFVLPAYDHPETIIIALDKDPTIASWGLIPNWVRDNQKADEIRNMTLNARSETLFEKPSYREGIRKRRCVIPSTGYYEYHYESKGTTAFFIYVKNEKIFSIGGIYDYWTDRQTRPALPIL